MDREAYRERIEEILQDEFEDEELVITYDTKAADVEGWDSLAHLAIIHEIERAYGIKFTMGEVQGAQSVGELIDHLMHHVDGKNYV